MAIKLSSNFSLGELTKSATAVRNGIDNTPTDIQHLVNLTHLAIRVLQPVRDKFGIITVNSGYRSPELNTKVGGAGKSQHCFGQAADFESFKTSNPDVAEWIRDNLDYDQLILEFYDGKDPNSGWVHCSYNFGDNRKKDMTAMKGPKGVEYKDGLIR